ncbi:MAG: hypothetical protein FD123_1487 [Bacteroidetes bacterium]|nr:MAG: hypothetical protein FD123_1487 [Bacteroidota bacterium]
MGLFSKFFKKKEEFPPADLGVLACDMHSHFIPGIDDGAKNMEDSLNLLRQMQDLGYKKVVTTPHVMSDGYRNTPGIILDGLEKVRAAAKEAGITLEIDAAAEYYFDFDLQAKVKTEKLLTFGNKYLLFEVSYMNAPDGLESFIFDLQTNGYKPILAHPERYPFWYEDNFAKYEKLKDKGVLFQMNINSLTGYYSISTKRIAEQMIDRGMIEFLGTDCHHQGHVNLMQQVRKEKYLHKLLESGKLLNNTLL